MLRRRERRQAGPKPLHSRASKPLPQPGCIMCSLNCSADHTAPPSSPHPRHVFLLPCPSALAWGASTTFLAQALALTDPQRCRPPHSPIPPSSLPPFHCLHITHLRHVVPLPPLVHYCQRRVGQLLGKGPGSSHSPDVRRDYDEVLGGEELAGEVVEDDGLQTTDGMRMTWRRE